MKIKKNLISLLFFAGLSIVFASCGTKLKPLESKMVTVEPQPLELVGKHVPGVINIKFPEKWFPKTAMLRITPVIKYIGGERAGTTYTFQGEDILGNDKVISYSEGTNANMQFRIPYNAAMQSSKLYLKFYAENKGERVQLEDLLVGSGVLATSEFASENNTSPLYAPDGFERIINDVYDADIMFDIQRANVKESELRDEAVEEWRDIVDNANQTPNQEVSVEIHSYASPDGGVKLNADLSEAREKNTKTAIKRELQKNKINGVAVDSRYTAQDWEGFRALVEKSNIEDKDLIIRVLEMYPNSEQREEQIKNLSSVFSRLADDILPKLRRSRLIANIKIIGKSDDEILAWAEKNPGFLNLEELLHAATLQTDLKSKETTYNIIKKLYPKDYRAYNNLGVLAWNRGDRKMAEVWFDLASKRQTNPFTTVNQGLLALSNGDIKLADELISVATNIEEAAPILGILSLKKGDYQAAQRYFASDKSNNAAVAQLLNVDYASAIKTLKSVSNPNADTYYLLAIALLRSGDKMEAIANLQKAIEMKNSLKYRIEKDIEFMSLMNDKDFMSIIK